MSQPASALAPVPIPLHGFRLASRALLLEAGERRSSSLGAGPEFSEFRPYQPGDDLRRVDWHVYARSGKLFVRRYAATRATRVYALLDVSASMQPDKLGLARQVLEFARGFAQHDRWLPRQADGVANGLRALLPQRPGLVLLVSDGLEPLVGLRDAVRGLRARGFDLSFVQVLSQDDLAPPDGPWRLQDAESGFEREVDNTARQVYLQALGRHLAGLAELLRQSGFRLARCEVGIDRAEVWGRLRRAGVLEHGV